MTHKQALSCKVLYFVIIRSELAGSEQQVNGQGGDEQIQPYPRIAGGRAAQPGAEVSQRQTCCQRD